MAEYSVKYYQVNIGTGDCEILLFLRHIGGKEEVYKAVLIDGGKEKGAKDIKRTFVDIKKYFDRGEIKIDVIIITHWDQDHYGGIVKLMQEDAKKTGPSDSWQVSWLRYDGDLPQSVLYCPYPTKEDALTSIVYTPLPPDKPTYFGVKVKVGNKLEDRTKLCKLVYDTDQGRATDAIDRFLLPTSLSSTDITLSHNLIGQELLDYEFRKDTQSATSPKDLIEKSKKLDRPGLFCVAANYVFLPPKEPKSKYEGSTVTEKNQACLVCLVIWPSGLITHYLAGDVPFGLEEAVMDWTGFKEIDANSIAVVKASHHGSSNSWPLTMGRVFKPRFVLVSANGTHDHPSWDVVFLIFARFEMGSVKPFITNYPSYLFKDHFFANEPLEDDRMFNMTVMPKHFVEFYINRLKYDPDLKDFSKWIQAILRRNVIPAFLKVNPDFPQQLTPTATCSRIDYISISSDVGGKNFVDVTSTASPPPPRGVKRSLDPSKEIGLLKLPSSSNAVYYITSSVVEAGPSPAGAVAHDWNYFVATLSKGYIGVDSTVSTTLTTVQVNASDELALWLSNALSPSSDGSNVSVSLSISAKVNSETTVILDAFGLSISMTPASKKNYAFKVQPSAVVGPTPLTPFDPSIHFLRFALSCDDSIALPDLLDLVDLTEDMVWFKNLADFKFKLDEDNSAFWFSPALGYYSGELRLQGRCMEKGALKLLSEAFSDLGLWKSGMTPDSLTMVAKKSVLKDGVNGGSISIPTLGFVMAFSSFSVGMFGNAETYLFILRWLNPEDALRAIEGLLEDIGVTDFKSTLEKIGKHIRILQASFEILKGCVKPSRISVDAEVKFSYDGGDSPVVFLVTYGWPQNLFRARLYPQDFALEDWRKTMPDYEPLLNTTPTWKTSKPLSILDLIPGVKIPKPPPGIPTTITQAEFEFDPHYIAFAGTLKPSKPPPGAMPPVSFHELDLSTSYNWSSKEFSFDIAATIDLHPEESSNPSKFSPPLMANVGYDSTTGWELTAALEGIQFKDLLTFFDSSEIDQVKNVLGLIRIPSVSLSYKYEAGLGKSFVFDGFIAIGEINLYLEYKRNSDGWQIRAALAESKPCTLSDIITDVCGSDFGSELPDFLDNIQLNLPPSGDMPKSDEEWENSPMYLTCTRPASDPLLFMFQIEVTIANVGNLYFSFIQASSGAKDTQRLLMFSLANVLPTLNINIPVIGSLKNPVDGLEFIWVHDSKKILPGLTRTQVETINTNLLPSGNSLHYKESTTKPLPSNIVITIGCHFMLLVEDNGKTQVALDYVFAAKNNSPAVAATGLPSLLLFPLAMTSLPSSPSQSSVAVNKKTGPLSITSIGLQYQGGTLFAVLDASLSLGPVSLIVLGFKIGFNVVGLFKGSSFEPKVELEGLAAGLNKPPLSLDGMFKHINNGGEDLYSGGVIVSVVPYGILAYGSYGTIHQSDASFKTFFIYGELEGPLVELGFATINGVKLGFGYNSHLKNPTVDNVTEFPMIKGILTEQADEAATSSNVLGILTTFSTWVQPQNNSLWFAAGLQVTAFKALTLDAVAVVEVEPDISLHLFAKAVFSFPPKGTTFVHVELGIVCDLIFTEGLLTAQASLSPNSYVYIPACHLSGGLAICYWFDPSPYAGDFVLSLGGYHPSYSPPSYYPKPKRLAISFKLTDNIYVEGNAYFAITPKGCMGGGKLDLNFKAGPLFASFIAYADFFIVWSPFFFVADIGVNVDAGFRGKWGFINYDVSVHLGANLHLEGPPFSGYAYIEFMFWTITIHFGNRPDDHKTLSLDDFWKLLLGDKSDDDGITLAIETGSLPGGQNVVEAQSNQQAWTVSPGNFSFLVQCRFALQKAMYKEQVIRPKRDPNVFSRPMKSKNSITSELTVKVTENNNNAKDFKLEAVWKNAPLAHWKENADDNDPNMGDGGKSTIEMLMGTRVIGPGPTLSEDDPPRYKVLEAMYQDVVIPPPWLPNCLISSPKLTGGDTLDEARTAWKTSKDALPGYTEKWQVIFKWKREGKPDLVGSQPDYLLDHMNEFYVDVPKTRNQ